MHNNLSCDSSARHTGGECGQIAEESPIPHNHRNLIISFSFPPPPPFFCRMDLPSGGDSSPAMEELLKHLTEISIRQQQIVEHMAARQGETEREVAALRFTTAPRVQPPDPRVHAAQLLPKMTVHDDIEHYLSMFETIASRKGYVQGHRPGAFPVVQQGRHTPRDIDRPGHPLHVPDDG